MVCSRRCSTLWRRGRAAQSPVGGCGTGPSLCQEEIQELPCAIRLGLTLPGVHSSSLDPYPTPTPYQVGPHPAGRAARARRPALLGYTPWLGSRAGSAAHLHTCTPAHLHNCTPAPTCCTTAPTCHPPATITCYHHLPPPPASQAVLRGVRAAAAGLLIATTLLLLEAVRSPPERAIALLVLAALNIDPARLPSRLGERFVPPLAMIAGAVLGVPLCLHVAGE